MSYRECSSEDSTTDDSAALRDAAAKAKKASSSPTSPVCRDDPPSKTSKKRKARTTLQKQPALKKTKSVNAAGRNIDHGGAITELPEARIPPWQTLPYGIIFQIFHYASYPLCDEMFEPTPQIGWLLRTALLCKAFAEPALSALYYAPPLSPPSRAQGLLMHLASQSPVLTYNYRSKVKYLDMEAMSTLVLKYGGRDPIDLARMISYMPQLRGIGIHFVSDQPRYQKRVPSSIKKTRPIYKKSLFDALEDNRISLRSWKWNFGVGGAGKGSTFYPWSVVKNIHKLSCFQSLQSLAVVKYQTTSELLPDQSQLAEAITALSNLRNLSLELSPKVNEELLGLLPQNLQSLHIVDCSSVTSTMLSSFLVTHGSDLCELVLDHNQSLSLSFIADLAASCPKLETFRMNLTYYNSYYTFQDSEPRYDALLLSDEVPTWPSSLQTLELIHLRKWDSDSTETFFGSLVDSASSLPKLRKLVLKASIEIGWRDRASFRDKWINKLEKVFLRKSDPPNSHLVSLQAFNDNKTQPQQAEGSAESLAAPGITGELRSGRPGLRRQDSLRFSHVEVPSRSAEISSDSDSDIPIVPKRRSTRIKDQEDVYTLPKSPSSQIGCQRRGTTRKRASSAISSEDSAIDDDSASNSYQGEREGLADEGLFIQGLCEVVDIRIDNLRPVEEQFNENDFLDEEPSGDEDWNGEDVLPGEGKYAW